MLYKVYQEEQKKIDDRIAYEQSLLELEYQKHYNIAEELRIEGEYYDYLIDLYGYQDAERILSKEIWIGQTKDQLKESWGIPEHIHHIKLKTKSKYIWHYNRVGKGRYSTSVTLVNNIVTGWKI